MYDNPFEKALLIVYSIVVELSSSLVDSDVTSEDTSSEVAGVSQQQHSCYP